MQEKDDFKLLNNDVVGELINSFNEKSRDVTTCKLEEFFPHPEELEGGEKRKELKELLGKILIVGDTANYPVGGYQWIRNSKKIKNLKSKK